MNHSMLPPYRVITEPLLCFDQQNPNAVLTHPLKGLIKFGPYSKSVHAVTGELIRIATIGPPGTYERVAKLFHELNQPQQVKERRDYLPPYPGCKDVLGVQIGPAPAMMQSELPATLDAFPSEGFIGERIAEAILRVLTQYANRRDLFDVVAIYLPSAWQHAFVNKHDFDLHDSIKAGSASLGVPTQILNDEPWVYPCRASVAWRLSIALYSKAGGSPWRIARNCQMQETAYIGLAYARRGEPEDGKYVTCCSQVFDADGGGMQFVAFDVGGDIDLRNPHLNRQQMRSIMARSVALYQRRNGGLLPRRVVVHKTSRFTEDEVYGTHDALMGVHEIECVQVQAHVTWRAVKLNRPGSKSKGTSKSDPDSFPVHRGTVVHLSGRSVLLWTGGNVPDPSSHRNYFQGGNSIPGPLLLSRFAGAGSLEDTAFEVLALTKMDWNNDALFDPLPVTLKYSQTLARVISHAPSLGSHPYPYRLFM